MRPMTPTPDVPTAMLEEQAIEQRRRIHNTVSTLRQQVEGKVRDTLNVERYAAEYALPAAGVAAFFSLVIGYSVAGVFKHMVK